MNNPPPPKSDVSPPPPPPPPPSGTKTGGGRHRRSAKQSSWMAHVKATMRAHPDLPLREALKIAGKTYKKAKRGGGVITPFPVGGQEGGRRRKTRRSRRGSLFKLY